MVFARSLGALGVVYLSLSLSVLFMIGQRGMATLVTYLRGAMGLVIIIVIATLLNICIFHFSAHPGTSSTSPPTSW